MTFHFPIGVNRASWKPSGTETSWTLGASQSPLAAHKNDICVITGVNNSGERTGTAGHTCNAATFLTARDVPAGIHTMGTSADQLIASSLEGKTRFRSLELGTSILNENPNAEAGYDPVLKDHLSWSNGTPLPKEINPSALFDRLFAGGTTSVSAAEAARRRHFGQSVIDSVRGDAKRLQSRLGKGDNAKLDEYLSGVRALELRIQATAGPACTAGARPGPPADVRDRVKQMLDLSVLAFNCDLTRVITFGYEHTVTEQAHPWVGVTDGYHIGVTHNQPGAAVRRREPVDRLAARLSARPARGHAGCDGHGDAPRQHDRLLRQRARRGELAQQPGHPDDRRGQGRRRRSRVRDGSSRGRVREMETCSSRSCRRWASR